MSEPIQLDLKVIAELLEETMCNAGMFDDYDEIIGDRIDDEDETEAETLSYHNKILTGIQFINEHTDNDLDPQEWQNTYDNMIQQ